RFRSIYLEPVIDGGVNVDLRLIGSGGVAGFLLVLSADVLLVIGERDVEIEGLVPLPDEGVLTASVFDLEDEVARRVEDRFHRVLALAGEHEARGEELAGVRILQSDLAAVPARHDADPTRPDLVGLEPLAALVAAGGSARRDLKHGDLTHNQERVLERLLLLLLERHRFRGGNLSLSLSLSLSLRFMVVCKLRFGEQRTRVGCLCLTRSTVWGGGRCTVVIFFL
ncbi:hypothetical protein CR513_23618, partial [Mucuna pruriens]